MRWKMLTLSFCAFSVSALSGTVLAQTPVNLYARGAQGGHGAVAAAKPEASQVGVDILKKGGNAVDAAVATAFALGVLEPNASGLGGGGFMIVKLANMPDAVVIDFRESAPTAARPDMYAIGADGKVVNAANVVGGLASGVPGEVAGLLYGLEKYGSKKLSRAQIIQPSIDWAKKGIPVTVNLAKIITDELPKINKFPATSAIYTQGGLPYELGDTIKNPELAATRRTPAARIRGRRAASRCDSWSRTRPAAARHGWRRTPAWRFGGSGSRPWRWARR